MVKIFGKKAIMAGLAGIILVLAVFILLIVNFIIFNTKATSYSERESCRLSALGQATAKDIILSSSVIETSCKTNTLRFYNDHVEIGGKTISVVDARKKAVVKKFSSLTDDIVNQVLAEEMRWCWYQFLEGKRSLFESPIVFGNGLDSTCFVCDDVSFDNTVRATQFSGLLDYMKNHTMISSNITYYQYLVESDRLCGLKDTSANLLGSPAPVFYSSSEECWKTVFSYAENLTIKADKNYFISFVKLGSNADADAFKDKFGGKTVNLETYASFILSPDNILNNCKVVKRGVAK